MFREVVLYGFFAHVSDRFYHLRVSIIIFAICNIIQLFTNEALDMMYASLVNNCFII